MHLPSGLGDLSTVPRLQLHDEEHDAQAMLDEYVLAIRATVRVFGREGLGVFGSSPSNKPCRRPWPPPMAPGVSATRIHSLAAALLAASTLLLKACEPGISTIDALYLSVMTFTTIGYGDVPFPVSPAGRAAVAFLALVGVAFFAAVIELFGRAREATDGAAWRALGLGTTATAALMLLANLVVGVLLCEALVDDANLPKGSILNAIYWSVITSTSVGFGDFHPTTDVGKLSICVYALVSMQVAGNAMDSAKTFLLRACTVQVQEHAKTS